ncbi:MAG: aldose 1-epimerase [Lachnospiraceae bacterium]|nr:aldose 1-epimerase [Lachnospiraceae bacterium]
MNIVEIKSHTYTAKINLSLGGNCISLYNAVYDAHILREPDYTKALDNPFLYGMPILFPVNRISGGRFEFEGREYVFPINEPGTNCHLHGSLHQQEFHVTAQTDNSVVCIYRSRNHYLEFPHDFEVKLEYKVTEEGLFQTTEITNLSETNMPCLFGFHTTFQIPFVKKECRDGIVLKAEVLEEYERERLTYLPTGKILPADETTQKLVNGTFAPLRDKISRHYASDQKGDMILYDESRNLSVVYENDKKFDFRLIFNGGADGFICLEPQNCLVNAPNTQLAGEKKGFDYIGPGESKKYFSKISLIKGDMR